MTTVPSLPSDLRSLSDSALLELLKSHAKYKERSSETHDRDHQPILSKAQPINLLFLGDSMFERFRWEYVDTIFSQRHVSFPNFFNAGVGGDRICNIIYRLASKGLLDDLKACGAKFIFVEMGTNDLREPNRPLQDVHLTQYALVIESLKRACPGVTICVCGINPRKRMKAGVMETSNASLQALAAKINELEQQRSGIGPEVEYMPADVSLNDFETFSEEDGVHLNKDGYNVFATTLQKKYEALAGKTWGPAPFGDGEPTVVGEPVGRVSE